MPDVTFIHGIAKTVKSEPLLESWIDAPRDGRPDRRARGVTISMRYWAVVLCASALREEEADNESAGEDADVSGAEDVGMAWFESLSPAGQAQMRELAAEVGAATWLAEGDLTDAQDVAREAATSPAVSEANMDFERVPLPGPVKRRLMKLVLRDVHHYLWDAPCKPRAGALYEVRTEIRQRALAAMPAAGNSRPYLVVGRSLGNVIAYDVLQNVDGAPRVDRLLTLGSPLGLDEVRNQRKPGWSRWNGFPSLRVTGGSTNVHDRLDPVRGCDSVFAKDFRREGSAEVTDISEPHSGSWRHSLRKNPGGAQRRRALLEFLDLA